MSQMQSPGATAFRPSQCGSFSDPWFVVQVSQTMRGTQSGEHIALRNITTNLGIRCHLPMFAEVRRDPVKKVDVERIRPVFPGYLFAQFNPDRPDWRRIHSETAVRRVFLSATLRPLPVPTAIVEALMARGRPGDGVIDKLYVGPEFPRQVTVGDRVKITSGPFADVYGICQLSSQKRIVLLLDLFAGPRVTVDRDIVEVVE